MANAQHQYPPPQYASPHVTPMPHPGAYPPPSKRPRLSPNPTSPYSSPQMANGALPNPTFSTYYPPQPNGPHPPRPSPETSQVPPPTGVMGPPSRPADEKPVDLNDLSDVLVGSGVDLREEEAALVSRYVPGGQVKDISSTSNVGSSFDSTGSAGSQSGYFDHHQGFNTLSQNVPGDRNSFYGAGTFNQPAVTLSSAQEQVTRQLKQTMRKRGELTQYHLNDPFLHGGSVYTKMRSRCDRMGVQALKDSVTNATSNTPVRMNIIGPDNYDKFLILRGQPLAASGSVVSEVLTLISLAARDRVRSLVEDSASLAKGRRAGSHGIVPTDLAEFAIGRGKAEDVTVQASSSGNHLKRSFAEVESDSLPTPISESPSTPVKAIAFPNPMTEPMAKFLEADQAIEGERAKKRSKRTVNGILSGETGRSGSVSGTPGPGTPGTIADRAPEREASTVKKTLSKKEQKKQENAKATEAQQHAATNSATNMALGGLGPKWLKPAWMTSKATPTNTGFVPPPRLNSFSQPSKASTTGAGNAPNASIGQGFGEFREDRETGSGIQIRDIVGILELDMKEKQAMAKAFSRMRAKR